MVCSGRDFRTVTPVTVARSRSEIRIVHFASVTFVRHKSRARVILRRGISRSQINRWIVVLVFLSNLRCALAIYLFCLGKIEYIAFIRLYRGINPLRGVNPALFVNIYPTPLLRIPYQRDKPFRACLASEALAV